MSVGGTISVVMARPVIAALERRGINPRPVLRAANLSEAAVDVIENRLPAEHVRMLWERAAVATRDPSFGVHVAESLPPGTLDVVEYIFATSTNFAGGLTRLTKYIRLLEDSSNMQLVIEPLCARIIRQGTLSTPQFDEFAMTLLFVNSRRSARAEWTPERLALQHEHPDHDDALARVFHCPIAFGTPRSELVFAHAALELPFRRSDSRLLTILERYADSLLTALPTHGTLVARVSKAIAVSMAESLPTLETTAAAFKIPSRTLQRQLASGGVTYSGLVDSVRRDLALKHIGDASLSITEIGYMLHFSDTTAFYRAFKRWTGEPPGHYRARLLFGGKR